jgi:hypothetical protein
MLSRDNVWLDALLASAGKTPRRKVRLVEINDHADAVRFCRLIGAEDSVRELRDPGDLQLVAGKAERGELCGRFYGQLFRDSRGDSRARLFFLFGPHSSKGYMEACAANYLEQCKALSARSRQAEVVIRKAGQ